MDIDVDAARRDTRGCHGTEIHLNAAGSALVPACVIDEQIEYLREEEIHGGYETQEKFKAKLESFYESAAKLLNCSPTEIAFMDSATRGFGYAIHSFRFEAQDRLLTSAADYGSNFIAYLQLRDKKGVDIIIIPDDETGQIDMDQLREEAAHPRSRMVAISHIPTGGGLVIPAAAIGLICQEHRLTYLLDACQSVGQLHVDVAAIGCDILTATGRKYLRGPRGTGLLYVRSGVVEERMDPFWLDQAGAALVSQDAFVPARGARCFEQWEYSCAGKVALARAIEYALGWGLDRIEARVRRLAARAREGLAQCGGGVKPADVGRDRCGLVTFAVGGVPATAVKARLAAGGIHVTVSSAGGGSRVWFGRRGLEELVRASVHYYNTEAEIDALVAAVAKVAADAAAAAAAAAAVPADSAAGPT